MTRLAFLVFLLIPVDPRCPATACDEGRRPLPLQAHRRPADQPRRQMGRLPTRQRRSRSQQERLRSMARFDREGRRRQAANLRAQERSPSALEPRRQVDPLRIGPQRLEPALAHPHRWRRTDPTHAPPHRSLHRHLVARRQSDRLHVRRLARVFTEAAPRKRCPQQETHRRTRKEPGQSEGLHAPLLPPLG